MSIIIRAPATEEEFRQYYHLRWQLLRAPWGEPEGSEKDELETQCRHFMALAGEIPLGVARLQFNDAEEAQLRYMAVQTQYRRQGVGRTLLQAVEDSAREQGCRILVLHARENAVEFYRAQHYRLGEPTYRLFNEIQHYHMQKILA